jgi:molybdopterin-containing oxidoreductase family iron-sulfur binding subunit
VIGKVEVMIQVILKVLKRKNVVTIRANMTLSGAAADKRLPMSTANQKQALVHIYNIVTGSSVAVSLEDKFKSEVTKATAIKISWFKRVLVSGIQDKNAQLLVLAINQVLASEAFSTSGTRQEERIKRKVAQLIKDMKQEAFIL